MTGRDPHEAHRVSTPLELLFDLTFVMVFGATGLEFAHLLSEGHLGSALLGFVFCTFAGVWAWINFSWFSSAYDTDDALFRGITLVQMVGVLLLALGVPPVFESIDHGEHVENGVMVLGYVVMRVAMVAHWLRAAYHDTKRRQACLTYVGWTILAQIGWIGLLFLDLRIAPAIVATTIFVGIEMLGPVVAEIKHGGTPWHAHHIAERYSLLAIVALGEGVVGTVAALSAAIQAHGWTLDVALTAFAGMGLTFGLWWVYFLMPSGKILHHRRHRAFGWGYGHLPLFGAIAAVGAGLHVAALYLEHEAHISAPAAVATVAVPVFVYMAAIFALYTFLVQEFDAFHLGLFFAALAVIALAVGLANVLSVPICLLILTAAPAIVVLGYQTVGRHHQTAMLARLERSP